MQNVESLPHVETGRLTLSGNQDVRNANELQRALTDSLAKGTLVHIDCNAVQSLDAACLQLLLAAKRESQDAVRIVADPGCEAARWIQYSGLAHLLLDGQSPSSQP